MKEENIFKASSHVKDKFLDVVAMKELLCSCTQCDTLSLLWSMVNKCLYLQKIKTFLFLFLPLLVYMIPILMNLKITSDIIGIKSWLIDITELFCPSSS